ncbi:zinc-binding dehydrogenase [Cohnella sp. REN36]|uniref:zinc-binding dehydrogenase n=1 Tax=Cohnella sp. REN36 TaxID=2887347 RepID=UPI001D1564D1|nr:zinc-binding dehydrogenase [Cohnella sp. REN36]MCC3375120.1 zinc-binding dehydrogenase [Cohnella sp. REN36]
MLESRAYEVIEVPAYGGSEVLRPARWQGRAAAPFEVALEMEAAGVSRADALMREGAYVGGPKPLFVPGYDIVGRVLDVGPSVTTVRPGDRVAALTLYGGYAEIVYLPESELYPVPEEVDAAQAVSIVANYMSAYQMLRRTASVRSGGRVLVHGASDGVGTALLQLGALESVRLVGSSPPESAAWLAEDGVEAVDSRRRDLDRALCELAPEGYDAVIDGTGSPRIMRSVPLVSRGGRLVVYGVAHLLAGGRQRVRQALRTYATLGASMVRLRLRGGKSYFYSLAAMKRRHPEWFAEDLGRLFELLRTECIAPPIAARLPLSQARRAHELLEDRRTTGKIVLVP